MVIHETHGSTTVLCSCALVSPFINDRFSDLTVQLELELHFTDSERKPGQDFQTQGHYGKVKDKKKTKVTPHQCTQFLLHPQPMYVTTKFQLPAP